MKMRPERDRRTGPEPFYHTDALCAPARNARSLQSVETPTANREIETG